MKKLGLAVGFAALLATPVVATADGGKLYYDDGTRLEMDDFDMKVNLQLQSLFTYTDFDEGADDVADFSVRRVRLVVAGNMLDNAFSYKVQNDFVGDRDADGQKDSALMDAWFQANLDEAANLRLGQMKTQVSRQFNASSAKLQMVNRSIASEAFDRGRNVGAMLHGDVGNGIGYSLGLYNGDSEGEGQNLNGVDRRLSGIGSVFMNMGEYGSREYEGDMRSAGDLAGTLGATVLVGQGTEVDAGKFDDLVLNGDAGIRVDGFSLQGEYFFSEREFDDIAGSLGKPKDQAYYVQAGQMLDSDNELALRFAVVDPDKDFTDVKDAQEFGVGLNHFLNGHNLKIQTGATWVKTRYDAASSLTDMRYDLMLAGYF